MRFLTRLGVAAASLLLVTSCSDSGDASDGSSADASDASAESSTSSDSSGSEKSDEDGEGDESGDAGDSGDSGTSDAADEEKAAKKEAAARGKIRDAARAYSDAFLTGDSAGAFDLLSTRCQDEVRDTFGTTVFEAQTEYGEALRFESFEAEVTGDSASVTYTFPKSELDKSDESWILEDLRWKLDDCPEGDA